jgi:hypothetical protein
VRPAAAAEENTVEESAGRTNIHNKASKKKGRGKTVVKAQEVPSASYKCNIVATICLGRVPFSLNLGNPFPCCYTNNYFGGYVVVPPSFHPKPKR